ncbi:MAG: hypothetical protein JNM56_40560 [Planctomycetia bacterium]|nr:hypothetical protein [Planctomycetia bacterium]
MVQVILTEEQTRRLKQSWETVQLCDPQGSIICTVQPEMTPEFIAELKRRAASPGPWFTGAQVQARLRALQEEWDRTGGFDHAHMQTILARLDEADPGHFRAKDQAG